MAPSAEAATAKAAAGDDALFAEAILHRSLWQLPPLLPPPVPADVLLALETCARAKQPREAVIIRSLRRAFSCAAHDNDAAFPLLMAALNRLASCLPAESRAGDVAAGVILIFAHGLGQLVPSAMAGSSPTADTESLDGKMVMVVLGFAGGTPSDLCKYTSRLYRDDEVRVITLCASEVPEVYGPNLDHVASLLRGAPRWAIHLFSKAGFLSLSRLLDRTEADVRLRPPDGIIWDSSPGSLSDYAEFVAGTLHAADTLARRAKLELSAEARARMDRLLHSEPYALAVRKSYAPMFRLAGIHPGPGVCHGLCSPFPPTTHHLFLFSDRDPVCSSHDIRSYCNALAAAGRDGSGIVNCVKVKGTHCDGLFWSEAVYAAAVRDILSS